jgi:hypothetical protein
VLRFLLAQLHLESLIGKTSVKAVRSALKELPSGSNAYDYAYETAMKRIDEQVPGHRDLAKQILLWITCAKRPLTTVELRHALAIEVGTAELNEDALPEIEDMVLVCVGLVTIDEQSDIIRLVHYTTQQYFDSYRGKWFANAEADITTTCVAYLSFDVFENGLCRTDKDFEERMRLNPFYDYSAQHWGDHAREAPTLCQGAIRFLESDKKVESSSQVLMAVKYSWALESSQMVPRQVAGLHLVAYFGITHGIHTLVSRSTVDLVDSHGRTALSYAAEQGHEVIVKLLLDTGIADADIRDQDGRTPLYHAAAGGCEAVVKLLLDTGKVDIDARDNGCWTPLSRAVDKGHEVIVKLLLDTGKVDVDTKDWGDPPVLSLDGDWDCWNCRTPLSWAAENGHETVVKLLLDTGKVDIDTRDQDGRTPLSLAAKQGHEAVVRMLRDSGKVALNARVKGDRTVLSL